MQQAGHQTAFVLAHSGRPCRRPPLLVRLAARRPAPSRSPTPYWCPATAVSYNSAGEHWGHTPLSPIKLNEQTLNTRRLCMPQVRVTLALLICELQWEWAHTKRDISWLLSKKRKRPIHLLPRIHARGDDQTGIQILLQINGGGLSECDVCTRIAVVQRAKNAATCRLGLPTRETCQFP